MLETLAAGGDPKWGWIGGDEDVAATFVRSKKVALVCIVDTEVLPEVDGRKLRPPFAMIVHHATVVSSLRGDLRIGDKIKVGYVTDSLPVDDAKRVLFIRKANEKHKGVLKYVFLGDDAVGDAKYGIEWIEFPDYSPELGQFLSKLASADADKRAKGGKQ